MLSPKIRKQFITRNPYSRPEGFDVQGYRWQEARAIGFHWGAAPGATAQNYRDGHQGKADAWDRDVEPWLQKDIRYGGYPFFVDAQEIVQVGEIDELYYHVGATHYTQLALERFTPTDPAPKAIGPWPCIYIIGVCLAHPDWTGEFEDGTLDNAAELGAFLCVTQNLDPAHTLFRHHDITGKNCPKFWVNYPEEWLRFQEEIKKRTIRFLEWEQEHIPR